MPALEKLLRTIKHAIEVVYALRDHGERPVSFSDWVAAAVPNGDLSDAMGLIEAGLRAPAWRLTHPEKARSLLLAGYGSSSFLQSLCSTDELCEQTVHLAMKRLLAQQIKDRVSKHV